MQGTLLTLNRCISVSTLIYVILGAAVAEHRVQLFQIVYGHLDRKLVSAKTGPYKDQWPSRRLPLPHDATPLGLR